MSTFTSTLPDDLLEMLNLKAKELIIYGKDIEIERLNYLSFQLNTENENLKEKMRSNESNMNFKEFIVLKRDNARLMSELNSLKQDKMNSNIKSAYYESNTSTVATVSPASSPLPPLKESMIKKKPIKKL